MICPSGVRDPLDVRDNQPSPPENMAADQVEMKLADRSPELFDAIESFIHQNAIFDSSIVQKRVIDEIGDATDAMVAFAIPMQNALLSMEGALHWAMFWRTAVDNEDVRSFPAKSFSADAAIRLISQVYDIRFQDAIMQHFEGSDSDSEDEGDDEDSSDGGAEFPATGDPCAADSADADPDAADTALADFDAALNIDTYLESGDFQE
jgi:hypothetical protein